MRYTPHVPGGLSSLERRAFFGTGARPSDGVEPSAIESTLADLERALCLDRCHAVVATRPGPGRGLLFRALAERLAASFRVAQVSSPAVYADEVCAQILRVLGEDPGSDAELRLLSVVHDLSKRGSALALLVEDATALPGETLRRLGRLAAVSRPDLRLALGVATESRSDTDPIARVVAALGVSAEKIVLESRLDPGLPPVAMRTPRATRPEQDAAGAPPPAARSIDPIRLARREPSRSGRGWLGAGLAVAAALSLLSVQRLAAPPPAAERPEPPRPVAAVPEPRLPSVAAEPVRPAAPIPADPIAVEIAPAAAAPAPEPAPEPEPSPPPAPVVAPAAPKVRVSLNARPWARIEIDGKDVGVTPLANLPLEVGVHRFRAELPDGRVIERTTRVDAYRDRIVFP